MTVHSSSLCYTDNMIKMIMAREKSGGIGFSGDLPWHLPEDMAFFKEATAGCAVIMGRVCYESIPDKFRPLKGRDNYVITHDLNSDRAKQILSEGALVLNLEKAIDLATDTKLSSKDVFIIGGAQIYKAFMSYIDEAIITELDGDFEVDTYAPQMPAELKLYNQTPWQTSEKSRPENIKYRMLYYKK